MLVDNPQSSYSVFPIAVICAGDTVRASRMAAAGGHHIPRAGSPGSPGYQWNVTRRRNARLPRPRPLPAQSLYHANETRNALPYAAAAEGGGGTERSAA